MTTNLLTHAQLANERLVEENQTLRIEAIDLAKQVAQQIFNITTERNIPSKDKIQRQQDFEKQLIDIPKMSETGQDEFRRCLFNEQIFTKGDSTSTISPERSFQNNYW